MKILFLYELAIRHIVFRVSLRHFDCGSRNFPNLALRGRALPFPKAAFGIHGILI